MILLMRNYFFPPTLVQIYQVFNSHFTEEAYEYMTQTTLRIIESELYLFILLVLHTYMS